MKKSQFDLLKMFDLRIGDVVEVGTGLYADIFTVKSDGYTITLENNAMVKPLDYLIEKEYRIKTRRKTYADKWDDLRNICDEMLNDFDNYGTDMGIAQVLAYTRKALRVMEMTDELATFNREVAKCVSIDACDEEGK
jgi:hypothetical protein